MKNIAVLGAGAWGTKTAVTVGKALGGVTLVAGGAAGAITTAVKAGSNWQDLSTGAKIGTQALQGVFSAATGQMQSCKSTLFSGFGPLLHSAV